MPFEYIGHLSSLGTVILTAIAKQPRTSVNLQGVSARRIDGAHYLETISSPYAWLPSTLPSRCSSFIPSSLPGELVRGCTRSPKSAPKRCFLSGISRSFGTRYSCWRKMVLKVSHSVCVLTLNFYNTDNREMTIVLKVTLNFVASLMDLFLNRLAARLAFV